MHINFKLSTLVVLSIISFSCRNLEKSLIGFWESKNVLLDGSPEVEAIEIDTQRIYCAPDTNIAGYGYIKLYFNFRKDDRYMITGEYVSTYKRSSKNCGRYSHIDTFSFSEEGSWTQIDKNTIILIPMGYSPINGHSGAYECQVVSVRKETLQLKCNINREIDVLPDGNIARVVKLMEIELVPVDSE